MTFLALAPALAEDAPRPATPARTAKKHPTLGGKQFWSDVQFFHGWRIQRNAVLGSHRLLDERDFQHASGSYQRCKAALEELRRAQHLPPMRGQGVVLLHGLGDTRRTMAALAERLRADGKYTVFNVSYASTRAGLEEHAKNLAAILKHLEGIEHIDLVGFSLGSLVIRRYVDDALKSPAKRADPRIRRLVMIGPPNHGSQVAEWFDQSRLAVLAAGQPLEEMGRRWERTEGDLAVPPFPFAIIAGGRGDGRGFNPLLPGDNDGLVTVQSARLDGAADFLIVPVIHTLLPYNGAVQQQTLSFLRNGHFEKKPPAKTATQAAAN